MGLGAGRGRARSSGASASACGSTAMVVCMHYCATAVIEAHGPDDVRRAIAAGDHLSTLAFSETGLAQPLLGAAVDRDASTATRSCSTRARAG